MTAIDGGGGWMAPDEGARGGVGEALRAAGHWLGAAASVATVVGIGFWGWETVTREAHGVPIVRALAGEMRVAPAAAGGAVAADQGLSLGAVQEGRGTGIAPDAVTLAPTGADIAVEDRFVPVPVRPAPAIGGTDDAEGGDPAGEAVAGLALGGMEDGVEVETFEVPVVLVGDPVSESLPGVSASPRPSGRPAIIAALGIALRGPSAARAEPVRVRPVP